MFMNGKGQLIQKNLPFIKILPQWAQELSYKYCSKTANLYFVHGNIRDYLPHTMNAGEFNFVKIQEYISDVLFGNEDIIVFYDSSSGVSFCTLNSEKEYLSVMKRRFPDVSDTELLSNNPKEAFSWLEKYFLLNIEKRIVFLIDYAETLVPAGDISLLDETDRFCLVTLNRWSHEPVFTQNDISIILLSENFGDANIRLTASPSVVKVNIPLPDEYIRTQFFRFLQDKNLCRFARGLTAEKAGTLTSGLNLFHLNQIAQESEQADNPITMDYLRIRKKEIIENEVGGMLKFLETEHDLSYISGHDFVKNRFKNAARAIKQNQLDVLPMGYLIAGPIGTGKSFLVSAFAGEIGIPMVRLCNFHSESHSGTETNLEHILSILKAMSPVAVMIDEADTMLGHRTDNAGNGSEKRVFAQIASFMGNTDYRGKIIWFLITSRPDLIPIDLKRQGRAEEHLALFYPETQEEKIDIFTTMQRKLGIKVEKFPLADLFRKIQFEMSGADIEAVLVRAKMTAAMEHRAVVTKTDLEQTLRDFIPPAYPHEIELQNLVAVLECTSREMVPKKYRNIDRTKLASDIRELKQLLGQNA
ncbi:MAG: AAA family ATPase [Bacteroides sp.]|nr:AAA family ATPase [Prevotella sp.]MCM1469254.1 AAA family ATPase [Bacteroides sp.]